MIDSTPPEMACRELVELVTDYLEGRLAAADRARFEAHISECEYCAAYLEQMRRTIRTLGHIPEESLPPDARDSLLTAFRSWRRTPPGDVQEGEPPADAGGRSPA